MAGKAGPIDLSGVEVFIADTSSLGFVQRAGFDVMLGLDALTQYPMWLDFEAGEVRFWTGQGEPSVPGVKPRAEQGVE